MGSTTDFKRTTLPFDTPVPIPRKTREFLVNSFGYVRAELDNGVLMVLTKKHKNKQRELVRINTNVSPPTIEFTIEDEDS
jgi:hypothetical protein